MMERGKRHSGIEIARIIAMLMILLSHYVLHGGFDLTSTPVSFVGVAGVNRLLMVSLKYGGFGVSVFVIISGYCGIHSTFKVRKVIQLLAQVLFYSVSIYTICLLTGLIKFSSLDAIKNVFPILFQQYWFATAYIILYLVSPYLNKLLKGLSRKELQSFLTIMLVLWCLLPTFTMQSMYGREIPKFVMLYTLGAYLRLFPDNVLAKPAVAKLGLILSVVLLFLSSLILQLLGNVSPFFANHYAVFYDSDSLLVVVGAACLVYLCGQMKIGSNPFINKISSATFSVFLIHAHVGLRYWVWKGFLKSSSHAESPWLIVHMVASVAIIYTMCTIVDLLRQKWIEKPFMGLVDRMLDSCAQKRMNSLAVDKKEQL